MNNVFPFREKEPKRMPARLAVVERRKRTDASFIGWLSFMFLITYALGFFIGHFSK